MRRSCRPRFEDELQEVPRFVDRTAVRRVQGERYVLLEEVEVRGFTGLQVFEDASDLQEVLLFFGE